MKQAIAALCLLAFSCVTHAQVQGAGADSLVKAFPVKLNGSQIEVFAIDYKMAEGQRFEARYIFDIARNYCLREQNTGTKLISHEPAVFVRKGGTLTGSLFRYRCGR